MHPAKEGFSALPFFDEFDLSTVDVLLISQYVKCSISSPDALFGSTIIGLEHWKTLPVFDPTFHVLPHTSLPGYEKADIFRSLVLSIPYIPGILDHGLPVTVLVTAS